MRRAPPPQPPSTPALNAEIVSIGRELLRGRTLDTNSRDVADLLTSRGAEVCRITTVRDVENEIATAIVDALGRGARLVVTTGGLGPTSDDRTLCALARALKRPLAVHTHAREMVASAYRRLQQKGLARDGLTLPREKMCSLPLGGEPIRNESGTAPGVLVRLPEGAAVLCLPGNPSEMRSVLQEAIVTLRELAPRGAVARREVETPTADESSLRPLLDRLAVEFPGIWIRTHAPSAEEEDTCIRVTLEATASSRNQAESVVEDAFRRLLALAAAG